MAITNRRFSTQSSMREAQPSRHVLNIALLILALALLSACEPSAAQVIPTARPTLTPTVTPSLTPTPDLETTPTAPPTATLPPITITGGPSPTPLLGGSGAFVTPPTAPPSVSNPNAARIEFFTSDVLAVAPGEVVTLFWSTRGVTGAIIYRLDQETGERSQLWNVEPDGSLAIPTRERDRGQLEFVLAAGETDERVEQYLVLPLMCPDRWFFEPGPETCPDGEPDESIVIEQYFERGRMIYVEQLRSVYALFNDGFDPAWIALENRYNPEVHPEGAENFVPPPDRVQPLRQLGFVWRGNDLVRNRLGLGLEPETTYEGFFQTETQTDNSESLYVSSADDSVLQLLPNGSAWQIITAP